MNSRYYNQSVNKYVNGEPHDHMLAKYMIAVLAASHNCVYQIEKKTDTIQGYTVDVELADCKGIRTGVNVDGGYHHGSKIQEGKTKTRDYILDSYYRFYHNGRYVVMGVEDVLTGYSVPEILSKLGIL